MELAADAEQVLITAAVDGDLPGNLTELLDTPITRYTVIVQDGDQGRVSILEQADE